MRIRFGWHMDGAPWIAKHATSPSSHAITAGPRTLLSILAQRLGLTHPPVEPAIRIAQFRTIMMEEPHPWYASSLQQDPWSTAASVLALRDQAIESGANLASMEVPATGQPRLAALKALSSRINVGEPDVPGANLPPGFADDLAEIIHELRSHSEASRTWPLGISHIDLREDPGELPGLWPELFALLETWGVSTESAQAASNEHAPPGPVIRVVEAPHELLAADAAAHIIEAQSATSEPFTILSTADSLALDEALAGRGLPPVAVAASSSQRFITQALPLFLKATAKPLDVHALIAMLSFDIPVEIGEEHRTTRLFGRVISSALIGALASEAGIDLAAHDSTCAEALRDLAKDSTNGHEHVQLAMKLLDLVTGPASPALIDGQVDRAHLEAQLALFNDRLSALRSASPRSVGLLQRHLETLRKILKLVGGDLTSRELSDLVEASTPRTGSSLVKAQVAPWERVTSPSHVSGGHVIWWGALDPGVSLAATFDPAEVQILEQAGAHILQPEELAALTARISLSALRTASTLTVIAPQYVNGEKARRHPLVSSLGPTAEELTTHRMHERDLETGARSALVPWVPAVPTTLTREVANGKDLLPSKVSFTQLEMLHRDALSWVLKYAYGIRPGGAARVPSGNAMIGTLVHAVIEDIVKSGALSPGYTVDSSTIHTSFTRLIPRFASELNLPGSEARRDSIVERATRNIQHLFATLAATGISVSEIEHAFTGVSLALTLDTPEGPTTRSLDFTGSIDFTGIDELGTPVILDFKWARSSTRYRDYVHSSQAIQLATYAWALATERGEDLTSRVGYYMLNQGEFVTADPGIAGRPIDADTPHQLWERLRTTIERVLTEIGRGHIASPLGEIALHIEPQDSRALDKALDTCAEEAHGQGEVFSRTNPYYSDYTLLSGLVGDYS